MNNCKYCKKKLDSSQYIANLKYKSCPRCSKSDGTEHIYYLYPSEFGTTQKRETLKHPDGPQSYCKICRGNGKPNHNGFKKCSEFSNE